MALEVEVKALAMAKERRRRKLIAKNAAKNAVAYIIAFAAKALVNS